MTERLEHPRSVSITWKVHSEMVLLAGWGRAILLQLAHPLVARGVAEHSGFLTERWGRFARLHRTVSAMLTLTFGEPDEIQRVTRTINGIHDRVHGELPRAAGRFVERTRYTAHDPALLAWVHATLVDSFLLTYELLVAPLASEERDRYCEESASIEALLGIPGGLLPRRMSALSRYMETMLGSDEIVVTATARALAREVVAPPTYLVGRPIAALARLFTIGLLPDTTRRDYGFTWSPRRQRALAVSAAVARRVIPLLPSPLRHWPAARVAQSRAGVGGARAAPPPRSRHIGSHVPPPS